jgi:hypothetical protein
MPARTPRTVASHTRRDALRPCRATAPHARGARAGLLETIVPQSTVTLPRGAGNVKAPSRPPWGGVSFSTAREVWFDFPYKNQVAAARPAE